MPATPRTLSLARRVADLQPSATLTMVARVRALQEQGVEVLDLTAGEPDFRPPAAAEEAGIEAIRAGRGRYTAAAGMTELREAAAHAIRADIGLHYEPGEVVVTTGAKIGICQALLALVDPGSKVLIPTPCWTSYPEMVRIAEAEPVLVRCGSDHLPRVADLEAARDEGCRALLLNTPCNPTGAVYPEALLREIGEWALAHDVTVISDEIYAALTYRGVPHVSPLKAVPGLRERAVWIGGMSKAYAMTGWRMGLLAAPGPVAKAIAGLQSQLASSPPTISQIASLAALSDGAEAREVMRKAFERRCELVTASLAAIPGLECPAPQGAFYAFPKLGPYLGRTDPDTGKRIESGDDLVEVLLEADHVATIGGTAFGDPQAFRISFAAAEETLSEAMQRLGARLAKLTG